MKKKMISLLCAAAMAASLPAGYGGVAAAEAADLEYVELDMYINDQPQTDSDMVVDALNEYLLETLNMKLDIHWLGSDFDTKILTMLQSGEDCGLVAFNGSGLAYARNAAQGVFYPMDELMEEYGTETKGLFSDDVWNAMKVDGHIYGVPAKKDNCNIIGYIYNETLADELGIDVSETNKWKNFRGDAQDAFLEAKQKRDELYPEWEDMPLASAFSAYPYYFTLELLGDTKFLACNVPGMEEIEGYDCDTVFNLFATEEYKEFCLKQQELMAAGVYPYDREEYSKMGSEDYCLLNGAWGMTFCDEHMYSNNFVSKLVTFENVWADTSSYSIVGLAIAANCANPERAMMLIELMNTDPYVATLLRFGIEGEHYVVEDGKMLLENSPRNSDPANRGYVVWYGVNFGNLLIANTPEAYGGPDGIGMKKIEEYNNSATLAAHVGFTPDFTSVTNEIAACNNVVAEFDDLQYGKYDSQEDVLEALETFNQKLKDNGVDTIIAEIQSQIDAWNAAQ